MSAFASETPRGCLNDSVMSDSPGPGQYGSGAGVPGATVHAGPRSGKVTPFNSSSARRVVLGPPATSGPDLGPTTYKPQPVEATRSSPRTEPALAFGALVQRWFTDTVSSPGPGTYHVEAAPPRRLASATPPVPGRGFGTSTECFFTPRAATVTAWGRPADGALVPAQHRLDAATRAALRAGAELPVAPDATPGPGEYGLPDVRYAIPRHPPGTEGFLATIPRFPDRSGPLMPGPGSYDPTDAGSYDPISIVTRHGFGAAESRWPRPRPTPAAPLEFQVGPDLLLVEAL